jgi:hypothetical protein
MGSWATLNVGGQDVFHWKSEVDPTFLFLFTRSDVSYIPLGGWCRTGVYGAGVIDSDGREWFNGCSSFCQSCWW